MAGAGERAGGHGELDGAGAGRAVGGEAGLVFNNATGKAGPEGASIEAFEAIDDGLAGEGKEVAVEEEAVFLTGDAGRGEVGLESVGRGGGGGEAADCAMKRDVAEVIGAEVEPEVVVEGSVSDEVVLLDFAWVGGVGQIPDGEGGAVGHAVIEREVGAAAVGGGGASSVEGLPVSGQRGRAAPR